MRAVIQRVKNCKVEVDYQPYSEIRRGLLILLGVKDSDEDQDIAYLIEKISNLRIFEDQNGKMNLSILDILGEIMIVSQFTLYGDCKKGRRPSFIKAAKPDDAKALYTKFVSEFRKTNLVVETGVFQAHMNVILDNDGPVTLLLDSEKNI
ncbi:D-tyrosyl-tRNA(Tyr) deacylase [Alkalibaculum sp. M08DMB]|uniref:D-aminoacyl-tRNA deacylase n=1 Tax=Alkalibaculum sporogenes TaxID=2655001 RepID=A0A6A7K530_9FIRM|nr:D-aminoacyl-tRNA deacylase [Alkalibaculum sporogenes]MPW24566.1 D-tyrosyl-tRNA(Tyr) deacylase [Alkalibaculum sporogenes]